MFNARIHVVIAKGYKNEYIFDYPHLEACIYVVNQEQAFEAVFQMKIDCCEAKPNSMWLGK
jgi:hypothetical protein